MIEQIKTVLIIFLALATLGCAGAGAKLFYDLRVEESNLTAKDAELQRLNIKLGLSESKLLSEKELNNKYKNELDAFPEELKDKIKEYDLRIQSRDKTIASLKNKISGGTTVVNIKKPDVVAEGCLEPEEMVIGYAWKDNLGRFHLVDPDIFIKNNEEFTSEQYLTVVGHVLYGKDGKLQVRRIEVKEVVPDGTDNDGNQLYKPVPGANVKLVDAKFSYVNNLPKKESGLLEVFTLRPFVSFDTAQAPGFGIEWLNLGKLIDYANVGVNTKVALDILDIAGGSLQRSRLSLGLNYHLLPPLLDTNLAIGVGVGTPFNHFGSLDHLILSVDAIFYLTP
jgi:hypothetical protein